MAMRPSTASKPTEVQAWILAARPKTLPAAAAPIIVAAAVAYYEQVFNVWVSLAALATALLLQIGANFANDLYDYQKGADTEKRLGPVRVTQAGYLSPRQVTFGMVVVFGLAVLLGVYLILQSGWPLLFVGVSAILAAIAYTGGPFPYGYYGLGDVFVFLFFGFAAVCGTYYAQAGYLSPLAFWSAVPMGSLSTAILVVNNLRDIATDHEAGKLTLAVRFGPNFARLQYGTLLAIAYLTVLLLVIFGRAPAWTLLSGSSLILVPPLLSTIRRETGTALNSALAGTGRLELVFALAYAAGLVIAGILVLS